MQERNGPYNYCRSVVSIAYISSVKLVTTSSVFAVPMSGTNPYLYKVVPLTSGINCIISDKTC